MPIYEYRCAECGCQFEVLQRIGEDGSGLDCPACGTARPERVQSAFAATTGSSGRSRAATGAGGCGSGGFT